MIFASPLPCPRLTRGLWAGGGYILLSATLSHNVVSTLQELQELQKTRIPLEINDIELPSSDKDRNDVQQEHWPVSAHRVSPLGPSANIKDRSRSKAKVQDKTLKVTRAISCVLFLQLESRGETRYRRVVDRGLPPPGEGRGMLSRWWMVKDVHRSRGGG